MQITKWRLPDRKCSLISVLFSDVQGGRGWLAFGDHKIIHQSFRRARIYKFLHRGKTKNSDKFPEFVFKKNYEKILNTKFKKKLNKKLSTNKIRFFSSKLKKKMEFSFPKN